MTTARDAVMSAIERAGVREQWRTEDGKVYVQRTRASNGEMTAAVLAVLGIPPDATLPLALVRDDEARIERATVAVNRVRLLPASRLMGAGRSEAIARAALAAADQEATP